MPPTIPELTFFLVAGEASGDLHGAHLIKALKKRHSSSRFIGHGGRLMAREEMEIIEPAEKLAVMGFTEVVRHLPYLQGVMGRTLKQLVDLRPDRIILIDYPGFNLRLARKVQSLGIPITYFILPQVWAWKEERIRIIRDHVDQALSIFPFEPAWFADRGVAADFVGHPFAEMNLPAVSRQAFLQKHGLRADDPIVSLLPGSRQQEIDRHWPVYLETVERLRSNHPRLQIVVGKAPAVTLEPVPDPLRVEREDPRLVMQYGSVALVASGTATLESAVLDIPMVVCYRLSTPTALLARWLNRAPYASMVNLIANRALVPEFLQGRMTSENLARALEPLLERSPARGTMLQGFEEVRRSLGLPGVYERAAELILGRTL